MHLSTFAFTSRLDSLINADFDNINPGGGGRLRKNGCGLITYHCYPLYKTPFNQNPV